MSQQITAADFLAQERDNLSRFEEWWKAQTPKDPQAFPEKMRPGDWLEQFQIFCERKSPD